MPSYRVETVLPSGAAGASCGRRGWTYPEHASPPSPATRERTERRHQLGLPRLRIRIAPPTGYTRHGSARLVKIADSSTIVECLGLPEEVVRTVQRRGFLRRLDLDDVEIREQLWRAHLRSSLPPQPPRPPRTRFRRRRMVALALQRPRLAVVERPASRGAGVISTEGAVP